MARVPLILLLALKLLKKIGSELNSGAWLVCFTTHSEGSFEDFSNTDNVIARLNVWCISKSVVQNVWWDIIIDAIERAAQITTTRLCVEVGE